MKVGTCMKIDKNRRSSEKIVGVKEKGINIIMSDYPINSESQQKVLQIVQLLVIWTKFGFLYLFYFICYSFLNNYLAIQQKLFIQSILIMIILIYQPALIIRSLNIFKFLIKLSFCLSMSYQPISQNQQNQSRKNDSHRNPIYPTLRYAKPNPVNTLQSEITSSLLLQQLIYYNYYYSFIFFYLYLASQIHRLLYFTIQYGVPVRIIVYIIFLFLEIFRLYNALHGNLKQSFPEICAFLMLTILTIAAQGILISPIVPQSPMQFSLLLYGLIFHCLQFLVCICTMSKLTQSQKALFLWRNPLNQGSKTH